MRAPRCICDSTRGGSGSFHASRPRKMERCKLSIDLDRADGVYYAGKKLSGVVKIELDEPMPIIGLELKLSGGSFVRWVDKRLKRREPRAETEHSAEEIYFDDAFILWGNGRKALDARMEELPKGRHLFPFQWCVPRDVPCSYEGAHGWVRYSAHCTLLHPCCKPGCNTSLTERVFFTVLRHLDLNSEDSWNEPVKDTKELKVQTSLCKAGRISCSLELPRSAYVPGEFIQADIDIQNMCPRKVKATTLTLRQIIKFGSEGQQSKKMSWDVCRVHGDKVKAGRHQCWTSNRGIAVPSLVPSGLDGCKFVDVRYELQLHVVMSSNSLVLTLPIIIGTVPFTESYLTSWNYRECVLYRPRKKQKPVTLGPAAPIHSCKAMAVEDADGALPKYRVYNVQTPRKTVVVLECSPGLHRRRPSRPPMLSLGLHHPDNTESVV